MKVNTLSEYHDCGNALDSGVMVNLLTKLEYNALDITDPVDLKKIYLCKANKRICVIIILGQGSDHRLAMMTKTIKTDHPHGNYCGCVAMIIK